MKKLTLVVLFLGSVHCLFAQTGNGISWSMSLVNKAGDGLPFTRPADMKEGDEFSLHIKLDEDAYCYVVAEDSDRNIAVLHKALQSAGSETVLGPMLLTPPAGSETLYVIVSKEAKTGLENKIAALMADGGSRRAGRELLGEVFTLRRETSQFKKNPEKPVAMGGAFRSGKKTEGTVFSGAAMYVETVVVKH